MKVFVSYSHKNGDFVWNSLVPVLKAGGAEVLIDKERFKLGFEVKGQMDPTQDLAERQVLCWSKPYAESIACQHEFARALAGEKTFSGRLLLLLLDSCPMPAALPADNLSKPLYASFAPPVADEAWKQLLEASGANLGMSPSQWLAARDEIVSELKRYKSVNVVVRSRQARWRELIAEISERHIGDMPIVDMHDGRTDTQSNLLLLMLQELGAKVDALPKRNGDLAVFTREMLALNRPTRIAIRHFDEIRQRPYCKPPLFKAWRWLVSEPPRPLTLLIQSRAPVSQLQPPEDRDSDLASQLTLVELQ